MELKFKGPENQLKTDLNTTICKIYLSVFEKFFTATRGISILKRMFLRRKKREFDAKIKLDSFLLSQAKEYMEFRSIDFVGKKWASEKAKNDFLQRVAQICTTQLYSRNWIEKNVLAFVLRYGW